MAARVINTEVWALTREPTTTDVDLPILLATTLVDEQLVGQGMTAATLKNIELLLAGHFTLITTENGPLAKKMIDVAAEGYHNVYKAGFLSTRFGQQAVVLDTSGKLAEMSDRAQNPNKRNAEFLVVTSNNTDPLW
jgi:hypothetical protein